MSDDAPFDGLSSLLRLTGVNVPARAQFIAEAMVSSTLASVTMGLLGGMIGSSCLSMGPLVPFFVGSWTGYTMGLVQHWRSAKHETLQMAHYYPTILGHGLYTDFGIVVPYDIIQASRRQSQSRLRRLTASKQSQGNDGDDDERALSTTTLVSTTTASTTTPMEDWIHQGGLGLLTWSILAAQSCRSDIKDLQRQERQKLMDAHQQQQANDDNDNDDDDDV